MDEETIILEEARHILADKRALLKKYPYKFSLRLSIRQWSHTVDILEKKFVESNNDDHGQPTHG